MTDKILLPILILIWAAVVLFYGGSEKTKQTTKTKLLRSFGSLVLILADCGLVIFSAIMY